MINKEFQENFNEYMFYLSIMLYDKYLKDKNILIDIYIILKFMKYVSIT